MPAIGFWISLTLYFDPGGFFIGYFKSNIIWQINFTDVGFALIVLAFFLSRNDKKLIMDSQMLAFVKYFIFIMFYFVLIYGYLVPTLNQDDNFLLFLIKQRTYFYAFALLFFLYYFVQSDYGLKTHYVIIICSGFIILSLFIFGQILKFDIVPTSRLLRYHGESVTRIGMLSYGLFQIVFPIAFTAYLLNKYNLKIPLKKILYIAAVLLILTYLITLTRRTFINIIAISFFIFLIIQKITPIVTNLIKPIIATTLVIISLTLLFPQYLGYSRTLYKDIILLITTGKNTRQVSDYRINGTGDLQIVKDYIWEKPWFGQGFTWMSWEEKNEKAKYGDRFAKAWDAAQEVPIYFVFFGKGIVGFIVYVFVYYFIVKALIRLFRNLKKFRTELIENEPILFLFAINLLMEYILRLTVGIYTLGSDVGQPYFMVQTGMLFGINTLIYKKYNNCDFNLVNTC